MTGTEKITQRILSDAQTQAQAIRDSSDIECAALRERAANDAEERYAAAAREGERESEQLLLRAESAARLEMKKSLLAARQQAVSEAFALAKQRLSALPEADYIAFLARQASRAAGTHGGEVILCAQERARLGAQVVSEANRLLKQSGQDAALTLSQTERPMSGGLILKQGSVEVNCTVDMLLELTRDELAAEVAQVLFGA